MSRLAASRRQLVVELRLTLEGRSDKDVDEAVELFSAKMADSIPSVYVAGKEGFGAKVVHHRIDQAVRSV